MLLGLAAASCATLDPSIQAGRSDAFFAANVRPGGTQAEIERVLGPPDKRERYSISGNEGWDYKYQDGWGYMALYSITFSPDGHVLSAISNRINSGGDHK
jgi:hypothetical protein